MNNPIQTKRSTASFAPVTADAAYPLELFRAISGLDSWAIRVAQKNGLRTVTVGRRKFVLGADFIRFLEKLAEDPQSTAIG